MNVEQTLELPATVERKTHPPLCSSDLFHGDNREVMLELESESVSLSVWPTPSARDQKGENGEAHLSNGTGRLHLDQLPNFVKFRFSPPPPETAQHGADSSPTLPTSRPQWRTPHASQPVGITPDKLQETELGHRMHRKDGTNQTQDVQMQARIVMQDMKGRMRLNPAFVCWLMGWPWWWTRAEPTSSGAAAMASWRSRQRSRLWSFFPELNHD